MKGSKIVKLNVNKFGSSLSMTKGAYILKDSEGNIQRYPAIENKVGEVVLMSGNNVSTGVLTHLSLWNVDTLFLTRSGRPVGCLRSLFNDCSIETRLAQYKATENKKGLYIAKTILMKRIESQNQFLKKHGLRQLDFMRIKGIVEHLEETNLKALRRKLLAVEGRCANIYFEQLFMLFNKNIRTSNNRRTRGAYDGLNNFLNYSYSLLRWRVYSALTKAKLEPFCGFLHSEQFAKPSLLCDIMELYRCNVDEFLLKYSTKLKAKDFIIKYERFTPNKMSQREYLKDDKLLQIKEAFYSFMESKVDIPRIRVGKVQTLETLISEECLLLAKYFRGENKAWIPRIPNLRC
jgi:CRISPR-associated protein Cas1